MRKGSTAKASAKRESKSSELATLQQESLQSFELRLLSFARKTRASTTAHATVKESAYGGTVLAGPHKRVRAD